jgi:hypothetical protein
VSEREYSKKKRLNVAYKRFNAEDIVINGWGNPGNLENMEETLPRTDGLRARMIRAISVPQLSRFMEGGGNFCLD